MRGSSKLLVLFLIIGLYSCDEKKDSGVVSEEKTTTEFDLNTAKEEIREKTKLFTEAHITKDTAYLNNIFVVDARVFPPNSEIVVGKKAISQLNTDWVNYGIHEFEEMSTSIYGDQNYLIDEGTYYLQYGEENITDKGKYINIWKNADGEWKICSNIWNTSLPME